MRGRPPPRSEAQEAANAKFRDEYAALQARNQLPVLFPSTLHRHTLDCHSEPELVIHQGKTIKVIRCVRNRNIIKEVRD